METGGRTGRFADKELSALKEKVEHMPVKILSGVETMFTAHEKVEHQTQAQLREIIDSHGLLLIGESGRGGLVGDVTILNGERIDLTELKLSSANTEKTLAAMRAGFKIWQWVVSVLLAICAIGVSVVALFH